MCREQSNVEQKQRRKKGGQDGERAISYLKHVKETR